MGASSTVERAEAFAHRFGFDIPVLQAPMAGASPPQLAVSVAKAGGLGALGAVLMAPADIEAWVTACRALEPVPPVQINLWIPDPSPPHEPEAEAAMRRFLGRWGPAVPADAGHAPLVDFDVQCQAILSARPAAVSSIMGVFPAHWVARFRQAGIAWFACATTLDEALAAQAAGADAVVAQGIEAGGHRGAFAAGLAERQATGLFALLPRLVDRLEVPVIAAGGIADGRGIAAALALGASAVQIGTALLRTPEAGVVSAWADALVELEPEGTALTRMFSGRLARAVATDFVRTAASAQAPAPLPYPVQRALTAPMRRSAAADNRLDGLQAWAGQSAWLARPESAQSLIREWWLQARALSCA